MRSPDDEFSSDDELVERALGGDKAALARLLERHRPLALSVCLRLLGRPEVAADVVQEAAVVALVGLERLRNPERFGSWLCGVAANVARRWLRENARHAVGEVSVDDLALADLDADPEQVAIAAERGRDVRAAVAHLPPGQREAATLYYLEERTAREVAGSLGITTGATKTRLHKARTRLRQELAHYREEPMTSPHSSTNGAIAMRIADVRREAATAEPIRRHVIVLEDESGDRRVPIYVGLPEATALALAITDADLPRPMTYALVQRVIEALGGRVAEVRVTRLAEQIFYAEVTIDGPGGPADVDARPSDAINLAFVVGAPIRVAPEVIEECVRSDHATVDESEFPDGARQIADEWLAAMATLHPPKASDAPGV
ncbi:MAG: bifunctional nuclease domain-containing protein [Acidimicrobiales bacterium]